MLNLDELERLDKKATDGPWQSRKPNEGFGSTTKLPIYGAKNMPVASVRNRQHPTADTELIVYLRNNLPEIIESLRRLEGLEK